MAKADHIFVYGLGYSHHGIDCGRGKVIHFESNPWRELLGVPAVTHKPPVICQVTREEFSQGRAIFVRHYRTPFDPETVVRRAESRLGRRDYSVFHNNCEHFAVWCKTGTADSTQVRDLVDATWPMAAGIPTAASLLRSTPYLRGRARTMAFAGALAVTAGAFTQRYLENRLRHMLNGQS